MNSACTPSASEPSRAAGRREFLRAAALGVAATIAAPAGLARDGIADGASPRGHAGELAATDPAFPADPGWGG